MTPRIRKDEDGSTDCSDAGEEGMQIHKPLINEEFPKSYNWVMGRASVLSARTPGGPTLTFRIIFRP